ncbi:MAG TPA: ABC transporter ATP-binding protein [Vicinamibacteria bacterium]|nr:ABC transporter ATP-binding protein [Vicinamibacteria bacterium]
MDSLVVSVEAVSKAYVRHATPWERLKALFLPDRYRGEEFWALREVSLSVRRGETVGIVGRNGSGKSTLLQLIAGTLTPTSGRTEVTGRVSALLELGSGFNPDFTGRENVVFQASLMGLPSAEIQERFPEIAAFADIGDFLDQPVRTYSSGMFVRLAFAVAISVNPELLIVDEALSVGDEGFQRKCYGRIRAFQERGGTVLFVSHSGAVVVDLCDRALLLDRGERLLEGPPKEVVSRYHKLLFAAPEARERLRAELLAWTHGAPAPGTTPPDLIEAEPSGQPPASLTEHFDPSLVPPSVLSYDSRGCRIESPRLLAAGGHPANLLVRRREYVYTYRVRFATAAFKVRFGMLVKTVTGFELGGAASHGPGGGLDHVESGQLAEVRFRFHCFLLPGMYFLNAGVVGVVDGEEVYLHRFIDVLAFRVQPEPGLLPTAIVDFLVEPSVILDVAESGA